MSTVTNIRSKSVRRPDGREDLELRPIRIISPVNPYAEGSAEVFVGNTAVRITATVDTSNDSREVEDLRARVGMLPRATQTRVDDLSLLDTLNEELSSIERLIQRSLYSVIPPKLFDRINIRLDCTILVSDAGVASAAIAGGWVAVQQAVDWAKEKGILEESISIPQVAAISAGLFADRELLDLSASEAAGSDFLSNFVFDTQQNIVDIKATFETKSISLERMEKLLKSGAREIGKIFQEQETALTRG